MRYLFDASSIYAIVKAEKVQLLVLSHTCDLARYEIGNILITERHLRKTMTEAEQRSLLGLIGRSLKLMITVSVNGSEQEVVNLAVRYNLSFYDAAYVFLAKKNNLVFVTEDGKLAKKIGAYVKVIPASEI